MVIVSPDIYVFFSDAKLKITSDTSFTFAILFIGISDTLSLIFFDRTLFIIFVFVKPILSTLLRIVALR